MRYDSKEQAQLECDLLNRRHEKLGTGRRWAPGSIKAVGWRETVPTTWWQPVEVRALEHDHGELAMHARRTCFHR